MNKEELLINANITKKMWKECYINEEDKIFTPYGGKSGKEIYQIWFENKDKKLEKKPSAQDILNTKLMADNAELLKANEEQKKLNADLLLKIAMLGGR